MDKNVIQGDNYIHIDPYVAIFKNGVLLEIKEY